ncbi:hypothetical protein TanjilG_12046 [Lupinus angustifolius]|uniref:DUF7806 domain-containing protein n=1 Tax=Lupinus angustifolius TaxID=3871 RepID=A0A1J7GXX7_LUPAN|nr:hypothetical protein TanjilG_12046 [Lupinus angustifolius]
MEALYLKLHDRYTKLKTKKLSELDQLSKEQEVKFMNYLTASEELIEHLKSENDKLHEELNELRSEVGSISLHFLVLSAGNSLTYEALSEEVEKLRKLQLEITSGDLNNNSKIMAADHQLRATSNSSSRKMTRKRMLQEGTSGNLNDNSMVIAENDHFGSISNTPSRRMTRSRRKQDEQEKEARFIISYENSEGSAVARQSTENVSKDTTSAKLLEFCTEANDQSGLQKTDNCNWLIQALFEYALGMKLSTDHQTEQICLSALHQSSGNSQFWTVTDNFLNVA